MYKIIVDFTSEIEGVYTHEEETANNNVMAEITFKNKLDNWFNRLCPHIDIRNYPRIIYIDKEKMQNLKIKLINQVLEELNAIDEERGENNQKRTFEIKIINDLE